METLVIGIGLGLAFVPLALACAYLGLLTLLSARLAPPSTPSRALRFDVVVPAHNERALIATTVASLRAMDWPAAGFRVIVIADNCTDETAALARAAGAEVWERQDAALRGKGYALAFAFERCLRDGWAQALVVVDADTLVDRGLLAAFAARLETGAEALQARYAISNPRASWRTLLMSVALGAFHDVRSRARERLGASCGIRGNGWCLTPRTLQRVPYGAFTLAEDLEYGIDLALAGIRVAYVDEADVRGEMVSSAAAAAKQRQRWEGGRIDLLRTRLAPLVRRGLGGDRVALDLAADLVVPPLGFLVAALAAYAALAAWAGLRADGWIWFDAAGGAFGLLALYVLRGWQLSASGWRGALALACAPLYVAWKLALLFRRRSTQWIRTEREGT